MKRIPIVALVASLAAFLFADGGFDLSPNLRLLGLDLTAGFTLPSEGVHTRLAATLGGAWEDFAYYRAGNLPLLPPQAEATLKSAAYKNANALWALGIDQGIIARGPAGDLLKALLYYRGRYDSHLDGAAVNELILASGRPDAAAYLSHSVLFGIAYDGEAMDEATKTRNGIYAEFTAEWGPKALQYGAAAAGAALTAGGMEYLRWNATAEGFVPLYENAPDGRNLVNLYAGSFASADYIVSAALVPQYVRQSFGGTDPRNGLGNAVRGFEEYRFDANFKVVNNNEIRLVGPGLFIPSLNPILLAYFDQGWYEMVGEDASSEYVADVGVGCFINVFDFGQVGVYLNYPIVPARLDSAKVKASIGFGLKF